MSVISLLLVAQVVSATETGGVSALRLQCRPSSGIMKSLDLVEFDIEPETRAFKSRRFFKGKEGVPELLDGQAEVTGGSITLTGRTPSTSKFEHQIRIDRTSGGYTMTMALDGNPTRPNLSSGICSRSLGKAF